MSRLGARSSIVAGLLAGIAVATLLIAAVVAFAPDPVVTPPTVPSPRPAVLPSHAVATPGVAPGLTAPTIETRGCPGPSKTSEWSLRVREPTPALVIAQVGGGTTDFAAERIIHDGSPGGIGPDITAAGLRTIMPRAHAQP